MSDDSEYRDALGVATRDLATQEKFLADFTAQGIAHLTRREAFPRGHFMVDDHLTVGGFYEREIARIKQRIADIHHAMRFERVQERLAWRYLDRLRKRRSAEPARARPAIAADPPWLRPMGMDEVITGRRIADQGA